MNVEGVRYPPRDSLTGMRNFFHGQSKYGGPDPEPTQNRLIGSEKHYSQLQSGTGGKICQFDDN